MMDVRGRTLGNQQSVHGNTWVMSGANWVPARTLNPPLPPSGYVEACLVPYGHSDQQPTGHDVGATQIVEEKAN